MKATPPTIHFQAVLYTVKEQAILRLPASESDQLPSRGQVAVVGKINEYEFKTVLEPDGNWGHWMRVDDDMQNLAHITSGDMVSVELTATKDWPEPQLPDDFVTAFTAAPDVHTLWNSITPMARYEWIRWINATGNADTRRRRIEVTVAKLRSGKRRPCCFNLAACTDPQLSRNGRLIDTVIST